MKLPQTKWSNSLWIQLQAIAIRCPSHQGSMAKPRGSCQPTSGFCPLAGKSRCSSTAAAMRAFLWHESRMSAPLAFCWDALSHLALKYENCYWGFSLLSCSACLGLGVNCCCFLPTHTHLSLLKYLVKTLVSMAIGKVCLQYCFPKGLCAGQGL